MKYLAMFEMSRSNRRDCAPDMTGPGIAPRNLDEAKETNLQGIGFSPKDMRHGEAIPAPSATTQYMVV